MSDYFSRKHLEEVLKREESAFSDLASIRALAASRGELDTFASLDDFYEWVFEIRLKALGSVMQSAFIVSFTVVLTPLLLKTFIDEGFAIPAIIAIPLMLPIVTGIALFAGLISWMFVGSVVAGATEWILRRRRLARLADAWRRLTLDAF